MTAVNPKDFKVGDIILEQFIDQNYSMYLLLEFDQSLFDDSFNWLFIDFNTPMTKYASTFLHDDDFYKIN